MSRAEDGVLRVGIVDFLNSRPLAWGFLQDELADDLRAIYAPPSRVADLLRSGELDVGLLPAVEVLRIPGLEILPGPCVAATREVRSVLLLARRPLAEVRRIAADVASRTSQALLRILLWEAHGIEADLVPSPPSPEGVPPGFDAALIIGDPALKVDRSPWTVVDLAAAWREMTGLPFVFAVWAVRSSAVRPGLVNALRASLQSGFQSLEQLAAEAAVEQGLTVQEVRSYLTRNLRFWLGDEELRGLREFYRRAAALDLVDLEVPGEEVWRQLSAEANRLGVLELSDELVRGPS
jgi:chorismate dehydratase